MSAVKDTDKGADVWVTREIRNPMGWIVGRTYRLAKLLDIPEVMELVQEVIIHMDNYCNNRGLNPQDLSVDVLPARSLRYITLRLSDGMRCPSCDGSGFNCGYTCQGCGGSGSLAPRH